MNRPIIIAENVSKHYILYTSGGDRPPEPSDTTRSLFRDVLTRCLPLRRNGSSGRALRTLVRRPRHSGPCGTSLSTSSGARSSGSSAATAPARSTLLKILSRITEPTDGDRSGCADGSPHCWRSGTGFHPELTGRENIYLNGAILGMRRAEIDRKFDEIVAFSEVEKFLDTPVKRYSSGMYVRLAFAVAAHLEPEILIVDEVLAVGDYAFQKKCLGKMRDVADGRRADGLVRQPQHGGPQPALRDWGSCWKRAGSR